MGAAVLNAAGDLRHHICCGRTLDAFRLEIGIARKLELLSMHVLRQPLSTELLTSRDGASASVRSGP